MEETRGVAGGVVCVCCVCQNEEEVDTHSIPERTRGDGEKCIMCRCCVTRKHQLRGIQCRRSRVRVWSTAVGDANNDFYRKRLKGYTVKCSIKNRAGAA